MHTRFLVSGTVVGGILLTILGYLTAAVLPPRYKQFEDAHAVVETVRANTTANDVYTAPQGLFVVVALRPDLSNRLQSPARHLAVQVAVEFAVALGLSVLLLTAAVSGALRAAVFLGLAGLVAGVEMRFPEFNWSGFPFLHTVAGAGYLAANWFMTGLALGALKHRLPA